MIIEFEHVHAASRIFIGGLAERTAISEEQSIYDNTKILLRFSDITIALGPINGIP